MLFYLQTSLLQGTCRLCVPNMLCVKLTPDEFPALIKQSLNSACWRCIRTMWEGMQQVFATSKRIVCFACEKLPCLFNFMMMVAMPSFDTIGQFVLVFLVGSIPWLEQVSH
jgi:hypothetical protein